MQFFLHGLGQTATSWDKTISYLNTENNINSIDLFLPYKNQKISYNTIYSYLESICNKTKGKIELCGLSLGAVLSLNYAINHPEKVKSLILIAPQYKIPKNLLKFQNIIFNLMPSKTFAKIGITKQQMIDLTSSMVDLDFTEQVKKLTMPVLIICGDKDKTNKKAAQQLYDQLKTAELRYIQNAKHEINIENPKKLARIINSFCDSAK